MQVIVKINKITKKYIWYLKKHPYDAADIKQEWARTILAELDLSVETDGEDEGCNPTLFVSNHISYIDIVLLMSQLRDCVFVSKEEIRRWPFFGEPAELIGTIFVNRGSRASRNSTKLEISRQLIEEKKRVVLFPSGTTSISEEKMWRKGAFEIAKKTQVPIKPIRIQYSNMKTVGYVGYDFLPYHLWRLTKNKDIKAKIDLHPLREITDVPLDLEYCRKWCNASIMETDNSTYSSQEDSSLLNWKGRDSLWSEILSNFQ